MQRKNQLITGLTWIFIILTNSLYAQQVVSALDPDKIFIGEHVTLSYTVEIPAEATLQMPAFDEMINEKIELLDYGNTDTLATDKEDSIRLQRNLRITSWEEGFHAIAPFEFYLIQNTDTIILESEPLLLDVEPFSMEEHTDLKDIKGILSAPVTLAELKYYILGVVVLAVLVWLILTYWRKRKKQPEPATIWEKPDVPAHIAAISSLEQLRAQKLWQQGKTKEYYITLTDIMRRYLEKRYGVKALEMTTAEIMHAMNDKPGMKENGESLQQILSLADLVKFAKYQPHATDNEMSMDAAFEFVNHTKPVSTLDQHKDDNHEEEIS